MTIQVKCPACDSSLRLSATPAPGTRFQCPRCGGTIAVAPAVTEVRPVPAPKPPPPPRTAMARSPAPRGRGSRYDDDYDDEDDDRRPRRRRDERGGGPSGLVWGLIGGGAAALLLIVGLLVFLLTRGSGSGKDQMAKGDDPPPVANKDKNDPPKEQPPKEQPPKDAAGPPKDDGGAPKRDGEPKRDPDPVPTGDGSLPRELLDKLKAATLYIRVQGNDGRWATGSGFFEKSSGMVLTNAHVVDMLKDEAPPPRAIEVIMNSNRPGERKFAGRVIAVDRSSDLAVISINAPPNELATFPTLTVAPAKDLLETQRVYVVGFPYGESVGKNVTISTTSVSSLQHEDGVLSKVQVNGGMHPGNSGGPVVDARGNVVGVAVSGIEGTLINFAIPGEQVFALLDGRLSGLSTANEPTVRGGKFIVPLRVEAIDPGKKIQRIAVDYWVGPANQPNLPASDTQPALSNVNGPRKTAEVAYNAETRTGQTELVLDAMPESGKALWVQPVVTNGKGKARWLFAHARPLAAPVEAKPAMLVFQPKLNSKQPLNVRSTANFSMEAGGRKATYHKNVEARLEEHTTAVRGGLSQLRLSVQKFQTNISRNKKPPQLSEAAKQAQTRDIGKLFIDIVQDAKGNLIKKTNDLRQVPAFTRKEVDQLGTQVYASLDLAAIPQPNMPNPVQPGFTWRATREFPFDLPTSTDDDAVLNITYTYRGVRQHNGKTVAVVALSGGLSSKNRGSNLRGRINGTAMIDPTTGMVISSSAVVDATAALRIDGDVCESRGTLDIQLTRGPDVK